MNFIGNVDSTYLIFDQLSKIHSKMFLFLVCRCTSHHELVEESTVCHSITGPLKVPKLPTIFKKIHWGRNREESLSDTNRYVFDEEREIRVHSEKKPVNFNEKFLNFFGRNTVLDGPWKSILQNSLLNQRRFVASNKWSPLMLDHRLESTSPSSQNNDCSRFNTQFKGDHLFFSWISN